MAIRSSRVRGHVIVFGVGAIALGSIVWAFIWTPFRSVAPIALAATPTPSVTGQLALIGINPEVLAAAGVTGPRATDVLAATRNHLNEHSGIIESRKTAFAAAMRDQERLESSARRGEPQAGILQAREATAGAKEAYSAAQRTFRNAALAALTQGQRQTIEQIVANRSWDVPVQYRVVDRTNEQWTALKRALLARAVDARRGESQRESTTMVLAGADAEPAVIEASASLAANLAAVREAFAAN